jgi:hypothetical protein
MPRVRWGSAQARIQILAVAEAGLVVPSYLGMVRGRAIFRDPVFFKPTRRGATIGTR